MGIRRGCHELDRDQSALTLTSCGQRIFRSDSVRLRHHEAGTVLARQVGIRQCVADKGLAFRIELQKRPDPHTRLGQVDRVCFQVLAGALEGLPEVLAAGYRHDRSQENGRSTSDAG